RHEIIRQVGRGVAEGEPALHRNGVDGRDCALDCGLGGGGGERRGVRRKRRSGRCVGGEVGGGGGGGSGGGGSGGGGCIGRGLNPGYFGNGRSGDQVPALPDQRRALDRDEGRQRRV